MLLYICICVYVYALAPRAPPAWCGGGRRPRGRARCDIYICTRPPGTSGLVRGRTPPPRTLQVIYTHTYIYDICI